MIHSFIGSLWVHTLFFMVMKLLRMLLLLSVLERSSSSISVVVGDTVTFPCIYNIKHNGPLPVCWGRGQIPSSGCDQRLLATDGHQVKEDSRTSPRYQLLGDLDRGDVSLTVLNVSEADAGTYGCRVEIPWWFNDDKHHFELTVVPKPTSSSSSSSTPLQLHLSTAASQTAGHMTSNDTHLTLTPVNRREGGVGLTMLLLSVMFGIVFVVMAVAVLIMAARRWKLKKLPRNNLSSAHFSVSSSSTLQLRGSAVDNIYQIECDEFDYCPYDTAH